MPTVFDDALTLTEEDDGKLFVVRVTNTGEQRICSVSLPHARWTPAEVSVLR